MQLLRFQAHSLNKREIPLEPLDPPTVLEPPEEQAASAAEQASRMADRPNSRVIISLFPV